MLTRLMLYRLSHTIEHGMTTYPGLPGPLICDYLSREASRANTPRGGVSDRQDRDGREHRDLPRLSLSPVRDRQGPGRASARMARRPGRGRRADPRRRRAPRAISWAAFSAGCAGKAVLVQTGWDVHWRTERYLSGHPFLTDDAADQLAQRAPPGRDRLAEHRRHRRLRLARFTPSCCGPGSRS